MNNTLSFLKNFWRSSIGKKIVVAVTGAVLALFLAGHLSGNMLLFIPDGGHAFNEYAYFLHHALHGALVWIARIVLLTCFIFHLVGTIQLTKMNRSAGEKYKKDVSQRSSFASKMMIWSGLTILAFVVYHILHFTARVGNDYDTDARYTLENGHHNAYQMVVDGFNWWPATLFYVIAVTLLCSHLSHGVASIFQTLGLRTSKTESVINVGAKAYSLIIWIGFISIPLAVIVGIIK